MTRARSLAAATLAGASFLSSALFAQTTTTQSGQNPPLQSVLAGKKFTPPIKGIADVEYTKPVTKKDLKTNMVVTKITVKNISNGPIPRLTIDETWFSKDNQLVTGGKGFINGLLQPGEVKTIEIQTPYDPKMNANSWNFSHANGAVKPHQVKTLDDPNGSTKKEPAAKTVSAKKK
jgi:hypothetical protein